MELIGVKRPVVCRNCRAITRHITDGEWVMSACEDKTRNTPFGYYEVEKCQMCKGEQK